MNTNNTAEKKCLECNEILKGRSDKKFCSVYCKSAYHYKKNQEKDDNLFMTIDKILKQNRRILKTFNKAGKATVRKETLIAEGFNPKYFTHYWKANNNNLYLFCYEYGFMEKTENGKLKYILVTWQAYMD
ncbi:MAG: hypothetical protein GXO79_10740 [Chlorobi bacterium]|nr:hypothetical protein [Chlorobiota bacterium]